MDGASVANEENATSRTVQFPDRGTHTASVQITDRSGKSVCNVSSTFHVQRTGVNSPGRQGRAAAAAAHAAPEAAQGLASADARAMPGRRPAWQLNASFLPRSRTSSPPT